MIRINEQEIPAGRIPSQAYHAGFDSVLPPDARAELRIPRKRPRILGSKPLEPTKLSTSRLLFGVFLLLLLVSAICSGLRQRVPLERSLSSASVPQPTPQSITVVPESTPAPRALSPLPVSPPATESSPALTLAPMPQIASPQPEHSPSATADVATTPDTDWHSLPVLPPPPRAQLLKLPVPKAQLIRLPDLPPAPRAIRILQRAREARVRDLHALNCELREVLRRVEPGPAST
jgi:hypothetical protein